MRDNLQANQLERTDLDHLIDKPIDSQDADILGFRNVAKSLLEAITAQPNTTSLTLGLDGSWGSGKSSILKMLETSIEKQDNDDEIGLVVIPFSPWLVTNRTALVASFFAQLGSAIDEAEHRIPKDWGIFKKRAAKSLRKARRKLNRFSSLISIASSVTASFDPTMISTVAAGSSKAAEKITRESEKNQKTLEAIKDELTASLLQIAKADPSFRIIVLVDDLDRLDPDDALEVLRLVKAVGDFPATTYLLAYDRGAIAHAIEHSAKVENGDLYLEKIIQFSFKVPPLEPFQLRNWLRSELDELFPNCIDPNTTHASSVLDHWSGRLLHTPRDVKRLLFSLRAIWPNIKGKADLLDLVWLQLLAQKASENDKDLYSWVVRYLQAIEAIAIGGSITGEKQDREQLEVILTNLGWKKYVHGENGNSMDFHHLDELLIGVTSSFLGANEDDWTHKLDDASLQRFRDGKRLSSPWHWRLYFAFDEPSHAVTDDEWNALVDASKESVEKLAAAISMVLDFRGGQRRDAADQIISRATHAATKSNLEHPNRWLVAITKQAASLEGHSKMDRFFGLTNIFEMQYKLFARTIMNQLQNGVRSDTIKEIFEQKSNICPASILLRDQFHLSKKDEHEKQEKYFLTDKELEEVSQKQLNIYDKLDPSSFRELWSPYDVLYAWRDVSGSNTGPKKLLDKAFSDEEGLVSTLEILKYVSSSSQNGIPRVPEGFLKNFVDTEFLKKKLDSYAGGTGALADRAADLSKLWWPEEK
ncbi:KAP family P-loop NTPase fold protein [Roseovarius aestuarii]|uniref:KAP family P-loop domain protein n=1 Tax=Roseovarius aestuarii TaxID=475083 RepID=A0A1X7BQF2_9RHOB|nr:P-loop NTPase fold protein [Roseovarius aestuarii]SMC11810.1 KAP family P-loop domain protein [Roseovarius aestuarii]